MKAVIDRKLALFGMFLLMFTGLQASPSLSRELATRLVAEAEQVREKEVSVGPMQKVQTRLKFGAVATEGICVTFIATKVVENTKRRVVCARTLYYDAEWGWYTYAIEDVRGGERLDIVSEHVGRFELR